MTDDLLERVRARALDNSFWRYLGVEVLEASEGRVKLRVPARDDLRNAPGAPMHGAGTGDVFADGRILRRGRTIAFGEASITDGAGKLLAVGRATYMILAVK
jgi:acyl-coenzyme A thioesterase PaaI-like protein